MNTIHLHGAMLERFGGPFELHVRTPAEAVRALGMQLPGFFEALREGEWRVVRGTIERGRDLGVEELAVNLPGEMHLVAAAVGSGGKGGGAGKVIVGTLLVLAAVTLVFAAQAAAAGAVAAGALSGGGAAAGAGGAAAVGTLGALSGAGLGASVGVGFGLSISAGKLALFGAGLIFSGVSQIIAPSPRARQQIPATYQGSYLYSGIPNVSEQGQPVPLLLGHVRCGGALISVSVEVEDFS